MIFDYVSVKFTNEGLSYNFPEMYRVKQLFNKAKIDNIDTYFKREFTKIDKMNLKGKKIAVTVGSRGIHNIVDITLNIVNELKKRGAEPFIVPAMGSHGGADADAQKKILESYSITSQSIGVPILSSMDVVEIGKLKNGTNVYCDKIAFETDGIVVVNKIKPHTDFKGDYESGILKMMAIGLGKHKGATSLHSLGFEGFGDILYEVGNIFLQTGKIIFAVGIVQNAYEDTMIAEIVIPENIMQREKELLIIAKKETAQLFLPEIDVLIVDEIGKNISGEGIDPNVTGRPGSGLKEGFVAPSIQRIVILNVDEISHGNGNGIGLADITTLSCVRQLDLVAMYTNAVTANVVDPIKIPLVFKDDKEAIAVAVKMCNRTTMEKAKIVRIKNTANLSEILVSVNCLPDLTNNSNVKVEEKVLSLKFNNGKLI